MVFKHVEAGNDDDIRKTGDLFIDKFPKDVALVTSDKGNKAADELENASHFDVLGFSSLFWS